MVMRYIRQNMIIIVIYYHTENCEFPLRSCDIMETPGSFGLQFFQLRCNYANFYESIGKGNSRRGIMGKVTRQKKPRAVRKISVLNQINESSPNFSIYYLDRFSRNFQKFKQGTSLVSARVSCGSCSEKAALED